MSEKKSLVEQITDLSMKLADPLGRIADMPVLASVAKGLTAAMPITLIGCVFVLLQNFAGMIEFLAPYQNTLRAFQQVSINFLSLFVAITVAMAYAERIGGVMPVTAAIVGLESFILITLNGAVTGYTAEGDVIGTVVNVTNFSAGGMFAALFVAILSVRICKLFQDRNLVIKMPDGVPPAVSNSFSSLMPLGFTFMLCWFVRSILNFDFSSWLTTVLQPLFTGADSLSMFTLRNVLSTFLFSLGLHGDNMLAPIFNPLMNAWVIENADAAVNGMAIPHIFTLSLQKMAVWPAAIFPLIMHMMTSKVKYLRTFGKACVPSALFNVIEPILFGLPIVMNPYLLIPFVLNSVIGSLLTYGSVMIGFCDRYFVDVPWVTPTFIMGPLSTGGDLKTVVVLVIVIAVGYIIYIPFFKMYENSIFKNGEDERLEGEN